MCMSTKITKSNTIRNMHVLISIWKYIYIYIYIRVKLLPAMCVERRFALSHIRTLHVKYIFLKAHSYKYIYTYMYMNIYIYIYINITNDNWQHEHIHKHIHVNKHITWRKHMSPSSGCWMLIFLNREPV